MPGEPFWQAWKKEGKTNTKNSVPPVQIYICIYLEQGFLNLLVEIYFMTII